MFGQIDMEDAIAGTVFAPSTAVTPGIATITILGHALSGAIWTFGGSGAGVGTEMSIAFTLLLLSLGNEMAKIERYAIYRKTQYSVFT